MHKPLKKTEIRKINRELSETINSDLQIAFWLQDVTDPINVGKIFRLADGIGAEKLIMTHNTVVPPNSDIAVTSRGMERVVDWSYERDWKEKIGDMKSNGWQMIGVELTADAQLYSQFEYSDKVCFVLGNEASGIYKSVLAELDACVAMPMLGKVVSFNVAMAAGMVGAHLRYGK